MSKPHDVDYMPVCVANVLIVAIFAALAYVFHTWWIVLFALIFIAAINSVFEETNTGGGDNDEK